ncbi:hypothetical protein KI387_021303 [Taxus chinensis]|uniref:Uncharacterized protein n=1 Tax=Taxus chinensis TaxID=29808 RepID=A0AA38LC83_TAXCH|nr:hypothetical protein KI387_021303 [Taxus chinensis]
MRKSKACRNQDISGGGSERYEREIMSSDSSSVASIIENNQNNTVSEPENDSSGSPGAISLEFGRSEMEKQHEWNRDRAFDKWAVLPDEALEISWKSSGQKVWIKRLRRASSPSELAQVLGDLENSIRDDWLHAYSLSLRSKSVCREMIPIFSGTPQTIASMAFWLVRFDAIMSANEEKIHTKDTCQKRQRSKDDGNARKEPIKYTNNGSECHEINIWEGLGALTVNVIRILLLLPSCGSELPRNLETKFLSTTNEDFSPY